MSQQPTTTQHRHNSQQPIAPTTRQPTAAPPNNPTQTKQLGAGGMRPQAFKISAAPSAACWRVVNVNQKILSEKSSHAFDFVNLLQQVTRAATPAAADRDRRAHFHAPWSHLLHTHAYAHGPRESTFVRSCLFSILALEYTCTCARAKEIDAFSILFIVGSSGRPMSLGRVHIHTPRLNRILGPIRS